MGKLTFRKQIEEWMEQDGLSIEEQNIIPLFKSVMTNVEKHRMTLREAYEKERPNIEQIIKDNEIQTREMIRLKVDEEDFFIQRITDNRVYFHVGYTEFEMSIKEVEKLINVLQMVIDE